MHWHDHHHPGMHHRRSRLGPIGRFVSSSLRRKLFAWFALAILTTTVAVAITMAVLSRGQQSTWHQDVENGRHWAGRQFASNWDNPADRETFARDTARALNVDLQLVDPAGNTLLAVGPLCEAGTMDAPVMRVNALHTPHPFNYTCEAFVLPNEARIKQAIQTILR